MLRRAFVLAVFLAGCSQDDAKLPPPSGCVEKCSAVVAAGAGSTTVSTGTGAGGSGGAGPAGTVTGVVDLLDESSFTHASFYSGAATIIGFDPDETEITAPYGGTNAPMFMLTGLGDDPWMMVQDASSGQSDILSTWSQRPSTSDITLAVVDATVLGDIATSIASPTGLLDGDAQVIIKVDRAGLPLSGVSVQVGTNTGGATVLYDAAGGYTDVGATGVDGTILLLNVPAGDDPSFIEVDVLDADMMPFSLTNVLVTANAATYVGFSI